MRKTHACCLEYNYRRNGINRETFQVYSNAFVAYVYLLGSFRSKGLRTERSKYTGHLAQLLVSEHLHVKFCLAGLPASSCLSVRQENW